MNLKHESHQLYLFRFLPINVINNVVKIWLIFGTNLDRSKLLYTGFNMFHPLFPVQVAKKATVICPSTPLRISLVKTGCLKEGGKLSGKL